MVSRAAGIMSLIVSICRLDSLGLIDWSMWPKPAALLTVSSGRCIFSRFFPNVAFMRYVVDVSSCSCKVGGFSVIAFYFVTSCISAILTYALAFPPVSCFSVSLCVVIVDP